MDTDVINIEHPKDNRGFWQRKHTCYNIDQI